MSVFSRLNVNESIENDAERLKAALSDLIFNEFGQRLKPFDGRYTMQSFDVPSCNMGAARHIYPLVRLSFEVDVVDKPDVFSVKMLMVYELWDRDRELTTDCLCYEWDVNGETV